MTALLIGLLAPPACVTTAYAGYAYSFAYPRPQATPLRVLVERFAYAEPDVADRLTTSFLRDLHTAGLFREAARELDDPAETVRAECARALAASQTCAGDAAAHLAQRAESDPAPAVRRAAADAQRWLLFLCERRSLEPPLGGGNER